MVDNLYKVDAEGRYKSTGTQVNDYERELLVILSEECAEVIQAVTKLLRFGKNEHYRDGIETTEKLGLECGDLECMLQLMREKDIVSHEDVWKGRLRKKEKLAKYMQHRPPVQSTAKI